MPTPRSPSDYVVKRSIPILDEHDLVEDGGRVTKRIDEAAQHLIASNGNKRIRETGDYCPIVIGHTKDEAKEEEQPEIVGYAYNFRVKRLGKTARYAIHADFKLLKSKYEKCRSYPRRSVELWPSRMEIDPIALLGATTPERDLGLIHYDRAGGSPVRYSRLSPDPKVPTMPPMPPDAAMPPDLKAGADPQSQGSSVAQEVLAMLKETDVWKWAEGQMAAGEQAPEDPNAVGAGADDGMVPPEMAGDEAPVPEGEGEDAPAGDEDLEDVEADDEDSDGDEKQQYAASAPAAGNTFVPGCGPGKGTKTKDVQARMARRHRDEIVQYRRALEVETAARVDLNARVVRLQRERDLMRQETEGLIFDTAEELDLVSGMDDRAYQKHVTTMRKRYKRAPVGGAALQVHLADGAGTRASGGRTRDDMKAIAEYATSKGLTYEQALTEQRGERVL